MKRVEKNEKELGVVYLYLSVLSGSRGSINLLSVSHQYLNPAHLVFHFRLDVVACSVSPVECFEKDREI